MDPSLGSSWDWAVLWLSDLGGCGVSPTAPCRSPLSAYLKWQGGAAMGLAFYLGTLGILLLTVL